MKKNYEKSTFLFYDYETFGKSPSLDRPAQFAGIRTDTDFNIIGEPEDFYCKPADDYLPQPEAVMITGITPQIAHARGINEADFTRRIHNLFSKPNTCIVGYNNLRFDDEVSRNLFYRNFYDPYAWSWQNGNSRWDILDVMRTCHALRPDGIIWSEKDNSFPNFRLDNLTRINGVEHDNAHDAMSDVYATIAMAKLVKKKQPRLYNFLFSHRYKHKIMELVDIPQMKPLLHISGLFGTARGNTSWIAPLAWHPSNRNALIICDLCGDMAPLLDLEVNALRAHLYARRDELNHFSPIPLKLVHINRCPVIAPVNTLRPEDAKRIGIDRQLCLTNLALLRQHPEVREKVVALYTETENFTPSEDVDTQIYKGFFSAADQNVINIIRQSTPENLAALDLSFNDTRIAKLLFRYRARNFPGTLNIAEQQRWLQYRREALNPQRMQAYIQKLESLSSQYVGNKAKQEQLKALFEYARELIFL